MHRRLAARQQRETIFSSRPGVICRGHGPDSPRDRKNSSRSAAVLFPPAADGRGVVDRGRAHAKRRVAHGGMNGACWRRGGLSYSRDQRTIRSPRMESSSSTRGTQRGTSPRSSAHTSMSVESFSSASSRRPFFPRGPPTRARRRPTSSRSLPFLRIREALEPFLAPCTRRGKRSAPVFQEGPVGVPRKESALQHGEARRGR